MYNVCMSHDVNYIAIHVQRHALHRCACVAIWCVSWWQFLLFTLHAYHYIEKNFDGDFDDIDNNRLDGRATICAACKCMNNGIHFLVKAHISKCVKQICITSS